MALSAVAAYDGRRCKIVTVTESAANAAASSLVATFAGLNMTDFQGAAVPPEVTVTQIVSNADEAIAVAVIAQSATGFTFRKLTTGAGATEVKWRVTFRYPRGIAA